MIFTQLQFSECYLIIPNTFVDSRGTFVKTFELEEYSHHDLAFEKKEVFYTVSHRNVLRGIHFQIPPAGQKKIIQCLSGHVIDVIIDLRKSSKTYKQVEVLDLNCEIPQLLFLPPGIGHGFLTLTDRSLMYYEVDKFYNKDLDLGIHWSSIGMNWPISKPIVSLRDSEFQPLEEFESPFD